MMILIMVLSISTGCKKNNKPKEEEAAAAETQQSQAAETQQSQDSETKPEAQKEPEEEPPQEETEEPAIDKDGSYFSKEEVALYIHTYGELPSNYITKKEAQKLGWSGGNVEKVAPGKAIGGDHFGNYEGLLPKKKGRNYYECDIDTNGYKDRGSRRIIFSDDGLIYYTHNHYKTFELLYGEDQL